MTQSTSQGDADAPRAEWQAPSWDEIVAQHSARVYRLAYRLTGNPHDAEDLTQEVFVRVFRSLSSYTPGTFEGWLHRITTNLFLDQARRKAGSASTRSPTTRETRLPSRALAPDVAGRSTGCSTTTSSPRWPRCRPDFRAAVVLCDIEGLTYEEIADVLGLKLGTVRSRIHRGRTMLRKALAHRAPVAGRSRYSGPPSPSPAAADAAGHVMPAMWRLGGHLGSSVSALVDGQLDDERPSAPGRTSCTARRAAGWSSTRAG